MVASGSIGFKGYTITRIALLSKLTIVLRNNFEAKGEKGDRSEAMISDATIDFIDRTQ